MQKILDSTEYVVSKSKHVRINTATLVDECKKIDLENTINSYNLGQSFMELSKYNIDEKLNMIFLFNSINFCFWGNNKWKTEINGQEYDGAKGLIEQLKFNYDTLSMSLNPNDWENYSTKKILNLLNGKNFTRLPLINKRRVNINEIGEILNNKYDGNINNLLFRSELNADKLLELITKDFKTFNDISDYNGKKIYFQKRSQLAIYEIYRSTGIKLTGIENLTAFADYKIPQGLRKMGILSYSDELSKKIDSKTLIKRDSEEEIEIRANSIWAIEFMKDELKNKYPSVNSPIIDSYVWTITQNKSSDDKPYHLTITTAY